MPFVLDSSVALAWVLPDENPSSADQWCDLLINDFALAPPIWPLEIGNVMLIAVKRGRITVRDLNHVVSNLRALPVEIDETCTEQSLRDTLDLAQKYGLTTYDASYLELAKRRNVPLASLDTRLRKACSTAKITLLPQ